MATENQIKIIHMLMRDTPVRITLNRLFPTLLMKCTIVASLLFFVIAAIVVFSGYKNKFTDILLLSLMFIMLVLYFLDLVQSAWSMRRPTKALVHSSNDNLKRDNQTIEELKKYDSFDIRRCEEHLDQLTKNAKFRAIALTGKLWELGLLPGIVIFNLTYFFQAQTRLPEKFVPAAVVAIVASYLLGLAMASTVIKIDHMTYLLRSAIAGDKSTTSNEAHGVDS